MKERSIKSNKVSKGTAGNIEEWLPSQSCKGFFLTYIVLDIL